VTNSADNQRNDPVNDGDNTDDADQVEDKTVPDHFHKRHTAGPVDDGVGGRRYREHEGQGGT